MSRSPGYTTPGNTPKPPYGPDHPTVSEPLNKLAVLYTEQGRYTEAQPLYKRALAIAEKGLGPDHPDVGRNLIALALLYFLQGRNGEAEPFYKRAIAIDEKTLGPDHPDVGREFGPSLHCISRRAIGPAPLSTGAAAPPC